MSEHTPLTEAERKVAEAITKWEGRGPTSLTVALLAEAVYAARDALAARTSTATAECEDCTARDREFGNLRWMDGHAQGLKDAATADTGHKAGCQEFPTGWLCVSDCTTVWHDKSADTGLRERVEALLVPEPEPAMVPDAPDLYWRRLGSPSEHATKGPHASWCVICQETCSRGLACRCCWPPVDQDDLRDALATPASTEDVVAFLRDLRDDPGMPMNFAADIDQFLGERLGIQDVSTD